MEAISDSQSTRPQPVQVIAVTSGKGGVGKTNVSINLSVALSNLGNSVMLMDADLGLANVDVVLGLEAKHDLSHILDGGKSLQDVLVAGPSDVLVVPASSGLQRMTALSETEHAGLIHAFSDYPGDLDVLLIDTAAGISDSVIRFCGAATEVLVVVCDEPASITDAYALIKVLSCEHNIRRFRILANMVQSTGQGEEVYHRLLKATDRFLDVTLDYIGPVPVDEYLKKSVQKQRAVVNAFPRSRSASAFVKLANRINQWPVATAAGHLEFFFERLVRL